MKAFVAVLVAAAIVGGFVGGELTGRTFTITGAATGAVGTAAILLALGAYFDKQEKKRRQKDLPPEIRAVFDRMTGKTAPSTAPRKPSAMASRASSGGDSAKRRPGLDIESTIRDLMAQDAEAIAKGQIPQRRLIPHHAIKRDVATAAYRRDLEMALAQLTHMNWTEEERDRRRQEVERDFQRHIDGLNRLGPDELDQLMTTMKTTRTDFAELERRIREGNPLYKIVAPL